MNALLRKDVRLNLPVFIAAAAFFVIPFVVVLFVDLTGMYTIDWSQTINSANGVALMMTQFIIAALGANALACERSDRSAEFLFSLPIDRGQMIVSKVVVSFAVAAMLWMAHLVIFLLARGEQVIPREELSAIAATSLLLFCASWMGSAFVGSPGKALGIGLAIVAALVVGWINWERHMEEAALRAGRGYTPTAIPYDVTCLILAALTFAIGCRYYLRRIEP